MTFSKILIANRGEISTRIIRAAHALGMQAVAVCSDADRNMPFVKMADEVVYIGPGPAHESYLNIEKVIDAAKASGAGAVHPGYGFLAENADFAAACSDAGLIFIGPTAKTIAKMGSKIEAKAFAVAAGVPVIPGYHGQDQRDETLIAQADKTGFPLMIKASAGGGGRGIRLVSHMAEFNDNLAAARKEAKAAFGNDDILLERQILHARHIEVQILADADGNVVHLFDRDCSLQRNHQKIIEEAPAPDLPAAIRADMHRSAVRLAGEIGYCNAGTVEFLYDPAAKAYYLLEMNTRLQVEHPVTEAITGIDIVQWQIRIAAGAALGFDQADIQCRGHAIEARVTAENPAQNFRPDTGRIDVYQLPELAAIRLDSAVEAGSVISPYYDSMIAKVIATGDNREIARQRLGAALADYRIGGISTNIAFLGYLLAHQDFIQMAFDTGSIDHMDRSGWPVAEAGSRQIADGVLIEHLGGNDEGGGAAHDPWRKLANWRLTAPAGRAGASWYFVRVPGNDDISVMISGNHGAYDITIDGQAPVTVQGARLDGDKLHYETKDGPHITPYAETADSLFVFTKAGPVQLDIINPEQSQLRTQEKLSVHKDKIVAPMAGLVSAVTASIGDRVQAGDGIVEFEAMKLLQTLVAPCSGVISNIAVNAGDNVADKTVLVTLEPDNSLMESDK